MILRSNATVLELQGTNVIAAGSSTLPALVVAGNIRQKHQTLKAAKLTVYGVTWLGGGISVTGTALAAGALNFQGSLLMGSATPSITGNTGPIAINKVGAVGDVKLTESNTISGIAVTRWTRR